MSLNILDKDSNKNTDDIPNTIIRNFESAAKRVMKLSGSECNQTNFDPDEYEKEKNIEIIETPDDINKLLTKKTHELIVQVGQFKFRLTDYTGKDNKV